MKKILIERETILPLNEQQALSVNGASTVACAGFTVVTRWTKFTTSANTCGTLDSCPTRRGITTVAC